MAAASVTLAPWLLGPAVDARVLAAGPAAAYLELPGGPLFALLAPRAVRLPIGVVLPGADAGRLAAVGSGARFRVGQGRVRGGGLDVAVNRWWSPRVPRLPALLADPDVGTRIRAASQALPQPLVDEPSARLVPALASGDAGQVADAVRGLVGLGPGLTPAGDDVVCGALAALFAAGAAVPRDQLAAAANEQAGATTSLSGQLLRCAAAGEGVPQLVRLLRALAGNLGGTGGGRDPGTAAGADGDTDDGTDDTGGGTATAVAELAKVGGTSGAALGHGALLALCAARPWAATTMRGEAA
jgi:hypothetical protein